VSGQVRSKHDLDRISQCVGKTKGTAVKGRSIVAMWREGAIRSLDRDLNRRDQVVK
jgi:hypothetical protein